LRKKVKNLFANLGNVQYYVSRQCQISERNFMTTDLRDETLDVFAEPFVINRIETLTRRPKTADQFVVRALCFQIGAGVHSITAQGVVDDAQKIAKSANIGGVTAKALYKALPPIVAALKSSNPMGMLQL
jgi:hypothetical protein